MASVSGSLAITFTALAIVPGVVGLIVRVIVVDSPAARLGIRHVTVLPERAHVP